MCIITGIQWFLGFGHSWDALILRILGPWKPRRFSTSHTFSRPPMNVIKCSIDYCEKNARTWTHSDRVTHTCVSIASDNGLSPIRRQAISWTNVDLPNGHLVMHFSEILVKIRKLPFKKMHLKMTSAKWRPPCLGLHVSDMHDNTFHYPITDIADAFVYIFVLFNSVKHVTLATGRFPTGWFMLLIITLIYNVSTYFGDGFIKSVKIFSWAISQRRPVTIYEGCYENVVKHSGK